MNTDTKEDTMESPIRTVTAAQCRVVAQPLRYQGGVPVAYRCANCHEWHPYDAPKLYDAATPGYHGVACAGSDHAARREARRVARWHVTWAANHAAIEAAHYQQEA